MLKLNEEKLSFKSQMTHSMASGVHYRSVLPETFIRNIDQKLFASLFNHMDRPACEVYKFTRVGVVES